MLDPVFFCKHMFFLSKVFLVQIRCKSPELFGSLKSSIQITTSNYFITGTSHIYFQEDPEKWRLFLPKPSLIFSNDIIITNFMTPFRKFRQAFADKKFAFKLLRFLKKNLLKTSLRLSFGLPKINFRKCI